MHWCIAGNTKTWALYVRWYIAGNIKTFTHHVTTAGFVVIPMHALGKNIDVGKRHSVKNYMGIHGMQRYIMPNRIHELQD